MQGRATRRGQTASRGENTKEGRVMDRAKSKVVKAAEKEGGQKKNGREGLLGALERRRAGKGVQKKESP